MPTLEIAATSLGEALSAVEGGAASLELCHDLASGGLTPALDLVRQIRDAVAVTLRVMIRPHAASFVYTPAEVEAMLAQVEAVKALGVEGVVFGALDSTGALDIVQIRLIAQAATPLEVTVHRALDVSHEPEAALPALDGIAQRILTAGPAATAWEGRESLSRWVAAYGDRFRFAASGAITLGQLPDLMRLVKADQYHIGGAARTNGTVDVNKVRQLRALMGGT